MHTAEIILDYFLHLTCITAIIIGSFNIKEPPLFLILLVLIVSEISNASKLFGYSPLLFWNIFIFTEFTSYIIYLGFLIHRKQFVFLISVSLLSFTFFLSNPDIGYETFSIHSLLLIIAPPLIIILGCFFYLRNTLLADYKSDFFTLSSFWLILGFLCLFLVRVLCQASSFILYNNQPMLRELSGNIIQIFYILFYLFSIKAFICSKRKYR